jgi:NAD(P)-dependent dehydrogenase (short-subunit alcohol dehydrogenase family)
VPNDILKLNDKRIVIAGPILSYSLDVASQMSRQGASVVFLSPDKDAAERLCQVINDEREISSNNGRAAFVHMSFEKTTAAKLMAEAATAGSGIDIYMDFMNWHFPVAETLKEWPEKSVQHNFQQSLQLAMAALEFFKGRKKGKLIFSFDGLAFSHFSKAADYAIARGSVIAFIESQAQTLLKSHIHLMGCKINLTEDMLLKYYPEKNLADSQKALAAEYPHLKITTNEAISKTMSFLASDLSQGVAGQILTVF